MKNKISNDTNKRKKKIERNPLILTDNRYDIFIVHMEYWQWKVATHSVHYGRLRVGNKHKDISI